MYRNFFKIIAVVLTLIVFVGAVFYVRSYVSKKSAPVKNVSATQALKELNMVSIMGVRAMPKANIKNFLIIGLDIDGKIESSNSYNNDYNADFLLLATFNSDTLECKLVEINRDSIVPVQRLDIFGQKIDEQPMQICLSYSYGDGLGTSARNTKSAVSDMFYGLNIDYYMVLSRDATRLAVDYVGGIDIEMDNDYTDIDPLYVKGSVHHMNSNAAMHFVSARQETLPGTNTYRMERQRCLLNNLIRTFQNSGCNFSQLYNSFMDYTLTDVDFAVFSRILSGLAEYNVYPVVSPLGYSEENFGHNEFYLNENSVRQIALDVFYDKI